MGSASPQKGQWIGLIILLAWSKLRGVLKQKLGKLCSKVQSSEASRIIVATRRKPGSML